MKSDDNHQDHPQPSQPPSPSRPLSPPSPPLPYTESDILFGDEGRDHVANLVLRDLILQVFEEYEAAPNGTDKCRKGGSTLRRSKLDIKVFLLKRIQATGGRFLKKSTADGTWKEVTEVEAKKKITGMFKTIRERLKRHATKVAAIETQTNQQEEREADIDSVDSFGKTIPRWECQGCRHTNSGRRFLCGRCGGRRYNQSGQNNNGVRAQTQVSPQQLCEAQACAGGDDCDDASSLAVSIRQHDAQPLDFSHVFAVVRASKSAGVKLIKEFSDTFAGLRDLMLLEAVDFDKALKRCDVGHVDRVRLRDFRLWFQTCYVPMGDNDKPAFTETVWNVFREQVNGSASKPSAEELSGLELNEAASDSTEGSRTPPIPPTLRTANRNYDVRPSDSLSGRPRDDDPSTDMSYNDLEVENASLSSSQRCQKLVEVVTDEREGGVKRVWEQNSCPTMTGSDVASAKRHKLVTSSTDEGDTMVITAARKPAIEKGRPQDDDPSTGFSFRNVGVENGSLSSSQLLKELVNIAPEKDDEQSPSRSRERNIVDVSSQPPGNDGSSTSATTEDSLSIDATRSSLGDRPVPEIRFNPESKSIDSSLSSSREKSRVSAVRARGGCDVGNKAPKKLVIHIEDDKDDGDLDDDTSAFTMPVSNRQTDRGKICVILREIVCKINSPKLVIECCDEIKLLLWDRAGFVRRSLIGPVINVMLQLVQKHPNHSKVTNAAVDVMEALCSKEKSPNSTDRIPFLIGALREYKDNASIQCCGFLLLSNLSIKDNNRVSIELADGIRLVLQSMWNHSNNIPLQIQGCRLLSNLAQEEGCRKALVAANATSSILASIQMHLATSQLHKHQLLVLSRMANADVELDDPFVRWIIDWLWCYSCDLDVLMYRLSDLIKLASDDPAKCRLFAFLISEWMHQYKTDVLFGKAGIVALAKLCGSETSHEWFFAARITIFFVLSKMKYYRIDSTVQASGCLLLAQMVHDAEGQTAVVKHTSRGPLAVLPLVLRAMRNHSNSIPLQVQGCRLLSNLAQDKDCRKEMVGAEVISSLLGFIQMHPTNTQVSRHQLVVLSRMANAEVVELDDSFVGLLFNWMKDNSPDSIVSVHAHQVLTNLAGDDQGKRRLVACVAVGWMQQHKLNVQAQTTGLKALAALCEDEDIIEWILAIGIIPFVLKTMKGYKCISSVQVSGCLLLTRLVDNKHRVGRILQHNGNRQVIKVLELIQGSMRQNLYLVPLQIQGCKLLSNLALDGGCRKLMVAANVISLILGFIQLHSTTSEVSKHRLALLCRMANAETELDDSFVLSVVDWITGNSTDSRIFMNALSELIKLAGDDQGKCRLISICLMEWMEQYKTEVMVHKECFLVLAELCCKGESTLEWFLSVGISIPRVLGTMQNYQFDSSVQASGCSFLARLLQDDKCRVEFIQSGGLLITLRALRMHGPSNPTVRERGGLVLCRFSKIDASDSFIYSVVDWHQRGWLKATGEYDCALFRTAGVDSHKCRLAASVVLGSMTNREQEPKNMVVQKQVILALGKWSKVDTDIVRALIEACWDGFLPDVSAIMKQYSSDVSFQKNACEVLANLTEWHWFRCSTSIDAANIISRVVTSMQQHSTHVGMQEMACTLLANLFWREKYDDMIVAAGGIPAVVAAMQRHLPCVGLQAEACRLLAHLAWDENEVDCCNAIVAANGIPTVLAAMQQHLSHVRVQYEGCRAWKNLAIFGNWRDSKYEQRMTSANVISALVDAMKRHESHEAVQDYGCRAFQAIAMHSRPECRCQIRDQDGVLTVLRRAAQSKFLWSYNAKDALQALGETVE